MVVYRKVNLVNLPKR